MQTKTHQKEEYLAPQVSAVLLKTNTIICASTVDATLDSWDIEDID